MDTAAEREAQKALERAEDKAQDARPKSAVGSFVMDAVNTGIDSGMTPEAFQSHLEDVWANELVRWPGVTQGLISEMVRMLAAGEKLGQTPYQQAQAWMERHAEQGTVRPDGLTIYPTVLVASDGETLANPLTIAAVNYISELTDNDARSACHLVGEDLARIFNGEHRLKPDPKLVLEFRRGVGQYSKQGAH